MNFWQQLNKVVEMMKNELLVNSRRASQTLTSELFNFHSNEILLINLEK